MRTTLDIDDDVLAAVRAASRAQGVSGGVVASMLLRKALVEVAGAMPAQQYRAAATGFRPFASRSKAVTNDAIDSLRNVKDV